MTAARHSRRIATPAVAACPRARMPSGRSEPYAAPQLLENLDMPSSNVLNRTFSAELQSSRRSHRKPGQRGQDAARQSLLRDPEVLETARDASKATAEVACGCELCFERLPRAVGSG